MQLRSHSQGGTRKKGLLLARVYCFHANAAAAAVFSPFPYVEQSEQQIINPGETMKGPEITVFVFILMALAFWDGVWKVIAMWKSARHNQLPWFICLAIFNTAGVLPIVYILFFQKKVQSL